MGYRLRDITIALLGILLTSGLWPVVILLLAVTQQRIFFVQERTGYHGNPFKLIKFSTLRDIKAGEREEDNQRGRLTPMGKILRRLSLDELPQLINVLKGEMSLVGPRPLIHEYDPLYSPQQRRRFEVRPGITGWAQVNGRNAITFTERFELDLWYIDHRSQKMDWKIMWMTAANAFGGKGVYADDATTSPKFDGTN